VELDSCSVRSDRQITNRTAMLSITLNTNEVMNASGTEVEFQSRGITGNRHEFAKIGESPALPQRFKVEHLETGAGIRRVRQSVIRFDYSSKSDVDNATTVVDSAQLKLTHAVGAHLTDAEAKAVLAGLGSFAFTLGTSTFKYDGTGTGAAALLSGGL